eukprot:744912_1
MNMAHILNQLRSFTKHIVAGVGRMEVSLYNPLSTLLRFFANDNPLVIEGLHDLEISQQLKTLNMDNLSSHTKRNQMIESLSQTLPDLQGNANTFKRIRFKAILSSYYASYFEIERMPIHQWTPTQVAFSFFVYLVQQRSLSTYVWQFVHHMALLCQEEALNGIVLYQLITKQNQKQNNLMQFTRRICNKFNPNSLPLVQQMQNEIKSWAQHTLKRAEIWFAPPCKRTPPHIEHPYHVFIEEKGDQSGTEEDVCRDSLDFDRIDTILGCVYEGFECNDLIDCLKKHKYMKQNLMDDLCDMVLGGEQNYVLMYQMLYDEMNITDSEKRQKIYYALLFQYINQPIQDLNKTNVLKVAVQRVWYDKLKDDADFNLMDYYSKRPEFRRYTKSVLLSAPYNRQCFEELWEPSEWLNITMLHTAKENKQEISPNTLNSPLRIICHVFGCRSLYKKLNHLDIVTQCEYLKMNNMDTMQKRKQFINKVSRNTHTRIQLNHVLLKYRQNIADLSLYDVHEWTPRHLLLSFVYYCIAKAETDPKMWGFVGHFSSYCVESFYDGNAFIDTDGDTQDKISGFDGIIKKFNLDVKLQTILWMDYPAGIIEEWIVEISKIERRSWEHVTCALRHELYGQIASRLNVIVDEYSIISDENVDTALNSLKEKSKLDAKEMEYIKCLIRRAMSSRSTSQYNTMNNSLDITSEMVGLGTQMCSDIYNVHNWFLFVNYRGEEYGKDMFKNKVMKHMECSHLQEEDVIDMMQRMSFIDLYPDYIIDDNRDLIWRYFFAASQLVHTLLSNELNDQAFALKIVVIPNRIVSVCNEKNVFPDAMGDIYHYLTIEKNANPCDVLCFTNDNSDANSISNQLNNSFACVQDDDSYRKQNDMLIVVDRRQSKQNNMDKIYIISNCDVAIFSELHAQYNISLHFDISNPVVRCYLYYGVHPMHKMRFFPEFLTSIIPRFFRKDEKLNGYERMQSLFDDKYKHGFAVHLYDPKFDKYYKSITGYTHVSVNYDRSVIQDNSKPSKESEYCAECSSDHPVGIAECSFIDYIIFCLNSFEDLSNIDAIRLTKCYTHIICVHSFCLDPEQRVNIKKYVSDMVGECRLQAGCPSMRQHATRDAFRSQGIEGNISQNAVLAPCLNSLHCYLLHDGETLFRLRDGNVSARYTSGNPLQFLDKFDEFIESTMRHTMEAKFVQHLMRWIQSNAYDWDSLEHDIKCNTKGNIYHFLIEHHKKQLFDALRTEYINDSEVIAINFGVSVLIWFKSTFQSKYTSLRDEILNNTFSNMTEEWMAKYETQCITLLSTQNPFYRYTLDEILSLKVYTDETDLTSKFRSAFWKSSSQQMKMEFYLWALTIYQTALYHARPLPLRTHSIKPMKLHHGISEVFAVNDRSPKYHGPVSTTVDSCVAETFSKGTGILWFIITNYLNPFKFVKGIDVSWIARYKHEGEILLNDEYLYIGDTHYYLKNNKLKADHLLYQLKIYEDKIIDKEMFWKQIGFALNDEMLTFIRDNPLIMQHSVYTPQGSDERVKVIERLVEELEIDDDYICCEYFKISVARSDAFLRRLKATEQRIWDKGLFLTQSGMVLNAQGLLSIQNHPLLFQYSAYRNRTIFTRLVKEFGCDDLTRNYFAVNTQNCKINAVLNGLVTYKTKIKLNNKFWKGIADAMQKNETVLSVIRKHSLLFKECAYKCTFVFER